MYLFLNDITRILTERFPQAAPVLVQANDYGDIRNALRALGMDAEQAQEALFQAFELEAQSVGWHQVLRR